MHCSCILSYGFIVLNPNENGNRQTFRNFRRYRQAKESLDDSRLLNLFTDVTLVFENRKAEGDFKTYLAHHHGTALTELKSFTFNNAATDVLVPGKSVILL